MTNPEQEWSTNLSSLAMEAFAVPPSSPWVHCYLSSTYRLSPIHVEFVRGFNYDRYEYSLPPQMTSVRTLPENELGWSKVKYLLHSSVGDNIDYVVRSAKKEMETAKRSQIGVRILILFPQVNAGDGDGGKKLRSDVSNLLIQLKINDLEICDHTDKAKNSKKT